MRIGLILSLIAVALCEQPAYAVRKARLGGPNATPQSILNPPATAPAFADAEKAIDRYTVAPGLKMSVFAAEPQLANPVALWMDEHGRAWVVETFRFEG